MSKLTYQLMLIVTANKVLSLNIKWMFTAADIFHLKSCCIRIQQDPVSLDTVQVSLQNSFPIFNPLRIVITRLLLKHVGPHAGRLRRCYVLSTFETIGTAAFILLFLLYTNPVIFCPCTPCSMWCKN